MFERSRVGVLRLAGSRPSFEQQLMSVVLATKGQAVASHVSALRLHGLRTRSSRVEVTVPYPADCRLAGVRVHRSTSIDDRQVVTVDGIATTSVARTVLDVSAMFPTRELGRIVDHAVASRALRLDELRQLRATIGRNRRGARRLDEILASQVDAAMAESGPEVDLVRLLTTAGLPAPIAQFEVRLAACHYRIDLAYPKERLALEYDGYAAHSGRGRFEADRRRQNHLVAGGWRVLRFTARDLRDDRSAIAAVVRAELSRPAAPVE